jgi:hypothetical protein
MSQASLVAVSVPVVLGRSRRGIRQEPQAPKEIGDAEHDDQRHKAAKNEKERNDQGIAAWFVHAHPQEGRHSGRLPPRMGKMVRL